MPIAVRTSQEFECEYRELVRKRDVEGVKRLIQDILLNNGLIHLEYQNNRECTMGINMFDIGGGLTYGPSGHKPPDGAWIVRMIDLIPPSREEGGM